MCGRGVECQCGAGVIETDRLRRDEYASITDAAPSPLLSENSDGLFTALELSEVAPESDVHVIVDVSCPKRCLDLERTVADEDIGGFEYARL